MIGNICLSIAEMTALERAELSMYAVHDKNGTTYTFYRNYDSLVLCSNLTEEQAEGVLMMLVVALVP